MTLKLIVGLGLLLMGLITAGMGIVGVGDEQRSNAIENALGGYAVPVIAGLSLAVGGLLIGLGMGDWKHPRTHLEPGDAVVDPEGYHKMKHV